MPADPVSRTVEIAAPADTVWALISDLPAMGRLSPENTGGRWAGGSTGPAVGARFRGANRRGARRWSTSVVVTECVPGRRFAFDVTVGGLGVARWSYDIDPTAAGCRVTETWDDRRAGVMVLVGKVVTGVGDRTAFTAQSIEQTLAALKRIAEAAAA